MLVFLTKCSVYFGRFWPVIKSTLSRNIWHHGSLWALAEQYDWKWVFHFGTVRPLSFLLRALKQGQHFENIIIFINFLLLYTIHLMHHHTKYFIISLKGLLKTRSILACFLHFYTKSANCSAPLCAIILSPSKIRSSPDSIKMFSYAILKLQ